ncbi:MAG: 6-hydroxymethylpterin diphosphokinase MptE-like protein [Nitrososphaeria archaeon]
MEGQYSYLKIWDINKYFGIANQLGLDIGKDYMSSSYMNRLMDKKPELDLKKLIDMYSGKKFLVLGGGPSLEADIETLMRYSLISNFVTVAADGASYALKKLTGINPNIIVTDLDGYPDEEIKMINEGTVGVVLSHGDNVEALTKYVPKMDHFIGTTQCEPRGKLYNFGGFTDGDRAVYLSINLNPNMIVLAGMDFGKEIGYFSNIINKDRARKVKKLAIGKKLLEELAIMHAGRLGLYNITSMGSIIRGFKNMQPKDIYLTIKGR